MTVWPKLVFPCRRPIPGLRMKTFVAALPVLLIVGAPMTLGLNRLRAAELPKDTNAITSLTPEHARLVVAEALPACVLQRHPNKSDRERAEILANKEVADVYESWATLRLNGLTTLDAETAKVLATFKGILDLDGLPALDPEAARHLAEGNCKWLLLHGLETLSPETAQELVKSRLEARAISLPRLDTLDAATAKVLATFKGQELILEGLVTTDVGVAKALAKYSGRLHLGLTTLDAETAKALAPAGYRENCRSMAWPRSTPIRPRHWRSTRALWYSAA